MKTYALLLALAYLSGADNGCNKQSGNSNVLKGRLEIKAACMNYTIKVMSKNIDTSLIVAHWTDETTMRSYSDVFALGSPCSFPSTIKQGDEFYFTIDDTGAKDCAVCMIYYPKPGKKLSIKVQSKE